MHFLEPSERHGWLPESRAPFAAYAATHEHHDRLEVPPHRPIPYEPVPLFGARWAGALGETSRTLTGPGRVRRRS
jgi:hypothetical protein